MVRPLTFVRAVPMAVASGPSREFEVAVARMVFTSTISTNPESVTAAVALARRGSENLAKVCGPRAATAATGLEDTAAPPGVGKPPPATGPVAADPTEVRAAFNTWSFAR